jgi:hypothetical protein
MLYRFKVFDQNRTWREAALAIPLTWLARWPLNQAKNRLAQIQEAHIFRTHKFSAIPLPALLLLL